MQYTQPMCLRCKHLNRDEEATVFGCVAFPAGIPEEIYTSQHDHTTPYPGDNGIRFEQIDEQESDNG